MTKWTEHLMKVYAEMKAKDSSIRLKDAMVKAKDSYKKDKEVENGGKTENTEKAD